MIDEMRDSSTFTDVVFACVAGDVDEVGSAGPEGAGGAGFGS